MRRFATLLMVLLIAALPLRGLGAVVADPCGPVHAHAVAGPDSGADHGCDEANGAHHAAPAPGGESDVPQTTCAHCVSCCSAAGTPPSAASAASGPVTGVERIPFRARHVAGHFPPLLDRPPLAA